MILFSIAHFNIKKSLFLLLLFFVASCESMENMLDINSESNDTVLIEEESESKEDIREEIVRPEWYNPQYPVIYDGDYVRISASAVSTDSIDAQVIGLLALEQSIEKAFNLIIDEKLSSMEKALTEAGNKQNGDILLNIMTYDAVKEVENLLSNEKTWFHISDIGTVRFYVQRSYEAHDMKNAVDKIIGN
ncbi:MAG: hypothetical protein WD097_08060 [Balneolales bacterium]